MLTIREIEIKLNYAKQRNSEYPNKPGRLTNWENKEKKTILKFQKGVILLMGKEAIQNTFYKYYSNSYKAQNAPLANKVNTLVNKICQRFWKNKNKLWITLRELVEAIK